MKMMMICCGKKYAALCLADQLAHLLHIRAHWLCDWHDRVIIGDYDPAGLSAEAARLTNLPRYNDSAEVRRLRAARAESDGRWSR
jgi:hypothetical protein